MHFITKRWLLPLIAASIFCSNSSVYATLTTCKTDKDCQKVPACVSYAKQQAKLYRTKPEIVCLKFNPKFPPVCHAAAFNVADGKIC